MITQHKDGYLYFKSYKPIINEMSSKYRNQRYYLGFKGVDLYNGYL